MNRNERNCGTCIYAMTLHTDAPCRGCWLDKSLPNYQYDGKVRPIYADAVTTTGVYDLKSTPKPKTYLTTYNPYMSKDWKTTCGELAKEYYGHFDVNSLYPAVLLDELDIHSPSKHLYEVSKYAAECFNEGIQKARLDGFNIIDYILDEFHVPEEEWKKRECEMDAMWNCFQSKMPDKEKEKGMHILIHRQLTSYMNECMDWVRNKLSEAGVTHLVSFKYNGRLIETEDRSLTIHFISGDNKSGAVGIRPNYYISDTTEMTEYLRTRGGEELTSVYKACELAIEHLKEKEKKEMNMGLIMDNDVVVRYPNGTEYKAKVDVVNHRSDEPTSMELHLLDERPIGKAHNTSKNDIVAHNTWEVEKLVKRDFPGARVYIQYSAVDIRLECAVVMDSYNTMEFTVRCDRAMSSHDASELSIAIRRDFEVLRRISRNRLNSVYGACNKKDTLPSIKDVKFENPATIVFWADGTKTVVRAQGEEYDPEKGLAMAISRKAMGNKREYYHTFLRWLKKFRKQKGNAAYPEDDKVLLGKALTFEELLENGGKN